MKTGIKEWYMKNYPTDELGAELSDATFGELYETLRNHGDVYRILEVGDSIVRERCFERLSEVTGLPYDEIYELWLKAV